jgi:hypothetical protein
MGAAGGSYGGYMTNWIAGHSNRFKALFTHAGVYNLENMYGATEEVWFSDWEFGGPYWNKAAMDSVYGAPASGSSESAHRFSRRRALDRETAKSTLMVGRGLGVVYQISEPLAGTAGHSCNYN